MSDGEIPTQTNFVQETSNNNSSNNSKNNSNNNSNSNNNRSNNHNRDKVILSNPINYDGEAKGVGTILGLCYEKFHKKLPFGQFIDKVYFYVLGSVC